MSKLSTKQKIHANGVAKTWRTLNAQIGELSEEQVVFLIDKEEALPDDLARTTVIERLRSRLHALRTERAREAT